MDAFLLARATALWSTPPVRNFFRKALYRVYTWAENDPIYRQPWAESVKKAAKGTL